MKKNVRRYNRRLGLSNKISVKIAGKKTIRIQ